MATEKLDIAIKKVKAAVAGAVRANAGFELCGRVIAYAGGFETDERGNIKRDGNIQIWCYDNMRADLRDEDYLECVLEDKVANYSPQMICDKIMSYLAKDYARYTK